MPLTVALLSTKRSKPKQFSFYNFFIFYDKKTEISAHKHFSFFDNQKQGPKIFTFYYSATLIALIHYALKLTSQIP